MHGHELHQSRNDWIAPSASTAAAVAGFFINEFHSDGQFLALPRPEIQLVVRFGPTAQNGLDVHALGMQQKVRRKRIRTGQQTVSARLHLGASRALFGVPASEIAGRIVALDELWGATATQRLLSQLTNARSTNDAATIVENAIAERLAKANTHRPHMPLAPRAADGRHARTSLPLRSADGRRAPTSLAPPRAADALHAHTSLTLKAAEMLATSTVSAVALNLGVSERHLRRVFRETIGVSPKAFTQLARFHRALRAAREDGPTTWAGIAAASGYYDQAHLIGEFRAIAGVTPRALLNELGAAT